jgi:tetratricopeptide (TPR) repeat protein
MMAFGGGMGGKTIPLGILIIEGENVRAELFPEEEKKPSFLMEMLPLVLKMLPQFMEKKSSAGSTPAPTAKPAKQPAAPPPDASLNNIKKLFEEQKFSEALEMADILLAKEPNNADLHIWKGNAMGRLAQGNPANMMKYGMGAMQEYETALRLDPQNQGGHFGRGVSRSYMGNWDGAIEDLEFACTKNPFPEACFYLGESYKAKGLTDKAKAAYKKALELKPGYPEAAKALAEIR